MDVENLFRKLRPFLGNRIDALRLEYYTDRNARTEIEELLHLLARHHLDHSDGEPLLPPPPSSHSEGPFKIGSVSYAGRDTGSFGLREPEWIQHVSIFGRTGSGKTNVGFLVFAELIRHGKPVWVFDWKRNYRDVALSIGVPVLTVGRDVAPFCFNPLRAPPGTQPETWLKKLVEIMSYAYGFRQATSYVLERALFAMQESDREPTFAVLHQQLAETKASGAEAQWVKVARRVVGTLCFGPVSNVLNGIPADIKKLLNHSVVFELDALTDRDKTFLIEALLLWIHQYRMQEKGREQFKHAIIIEEAHHILLAHTLSRENVMDVVLREIRELGESVILIDQHPSLISRPSLGNTYCTIAMNLKHGADVSTLGNALQLDSDCRDALGRLEIGTAIVRLQGRWQQPFYVKFPKFDINKGSVSDSDIRSNPRPSDANANIPPRHVVSASIPQAQPSDENAEGKRQENERRCFLLLADVARNLASGVAQRYQRLGLSGSAGDATKTELLRRGWVRNVTVRLRGRNITSLPLTSAGLAALRSGGFHESYAAPDDRAGPEHEFWKAWIFCELKRGGLQVSSEERLRNGHRVDILVQAINEKVAIEVETGKSNLAGNLAAVADAGIRKCTVVLVRKVDEAKKVAPGALQVRWVSAQSIVSSADLI